MIVAHSSEIEIEKSLILREKRLDLLGGGKYESKKIFKQFIYWCISFF